MNMQVFTEGFLTRLVPVNNEVMLNAIRNFHFEEYGTNAALAAAGALLALLVYYGIGIWLRRMPAKVSTPEQIAKVEKLRATANYWLPWLLVLAPTPLGGVVVMAAGFFEIAGKKVLAIVIAAEILWRAMPYLR